MKHWWIQGTLTDETDGNYQLVVWLWTLERVMGSELTPRFLQEIEMTRCLHLLNRKQCKGIKF